MRLQYIKIMLAAAWVLSAVIVGATADMSTAGRVALAAFGLLPPLGMWLLWKEPPQTMSESIHEGRR